MKTSFRARRVCLVPLLAAAVLVRALPSQAQPATGQAGPYRFKADHLLTPGAISNGILRLEGNVRLYTPDLKTSPQVDLSAPLVTVDRKGGRVRGAGGVSLKYGGVRRATRPNEADLPIQVEAKAREVLLEPAADGRRTLTLTGDLSGFYQLGSERTQLSGQKAVISFGQNSNDVQATFDGGPGGFSLTLPAQNFGSQLPLGAITLSGGNAALDRLKNTARIQGGARLTSDGPAKLQIAGASFDATFATSGATRALSRLASSGRVTLSLALPPDEIGVSYNGAADATYPLSATSAILRLVPQATPAAAPAPIQTPKDAGAGNDTGAPKKPDTSLVPVRLEISADNAVIEPRTLPNSTQQTFALTLTGNVRGSYVLREVLTSSRPAPAPRPANGNPNGAAATANAEDRQPLSLDLDIRGAQIELPSSFGFDL